MLFFTKDNSIASPRRGLFVFFGAFLLIIGTTLGGFYLWDGYFSEGARYARQMEANMDKYYDWEASYTKAMTEDTFGGKTPEETLQMFIAALRKEDIDLASKYFMLNTAGKVDQKWIDGLAQAKKENRIAEIADLMSKLLFNSSHSSVDSVWFTSLGADGLIDYSVIFKLNSFSKKWKIDSL